MLLALGCGGGGAPSPGPEQRALVLDVVGENQLAIGFGQAKSLTVRLHTDDAEQQPVPNATVRFSIFRDPAGSTLSSDRGLTDASGQATVTVTGGQAAAAFIVAATTSGAPEADIDVTVTNHIEDLVELDVALSWTGPAATTTLTALLYDQERCADLPAAAAGPAPFRAFAVKATNQATIPLERLLPQDYSVAGRAEDAMGRLVGYACVDVAQALLPLGSTSTLQLPLAAALASPAGQYTLTSALVPATAATAAVLAPWKTIGCPYGVGQLLLDAMAVDQGAADANGCKSAAADMQVQALLTGTSPGKDLSAIYADLQALLATVTVHSQLLVSAAGPGRWTAEHVLTDAILPGQLKATDLVSYGLPIIDVSNIAVTYDGAQLGLGPHGFTFGWTRLWRDALGASIATHAPGQTLATLMAGVVGGGKCAQVSAIVCNGAGGCDKTAACSAAADGIDAAWQAALAPATGIDLSWSGSGTAVAGKAFTVDQLVAGSWSGAALAGGSFSGARAMVSPP